MTCRALPNHPPCVSMKAALLYDRPSYFHRCRLTHLAECGGAALGNLSLQHTNKFTELHAIIKLLHEKLCSHLLSWKKWKDTTLNVQHNPNDPTFLSATAREKSGNYSPDLIQNFFHSISSFFSPYTVFCCRILKNFTLTV